MHNQKYLETIYKYFAQDINRGDEKYQQTPESKNYFRKVEENRKDTVLFDRLQENIATERNANVLVRNIDINYVAQFYLPEKIGYQKFEACVFVVSGITNLFSVYLLSDITKATTLEGIRSNEELEIINTVSTQIQLVYKDYEPFDMDFYNTRVPGVFANLRYNDYATYYECLLTDHLY